MNYYEDFLEIIDPAALDELIKNTPGSDKVEKAIRGVNKMIKLIKKGSKREEFEQKLSICLALVNELWFNIGWSCGWTAGAVAISKLTGINKVDVKNIDIQRSNLNAEDNKRNRQGLHSERAKGDVGRICNNTT